MYRGANFKPFHDSFQGLAARLMLYKSPVALIKCRWVRYYFSLALAKCR